MLQPGLKRRLTRVFVSAAAVAALGASSALAAAGRHRRTVGGRDSGRGRDRPQPQPPVDRERPAAGTVHQGLDRHRHRVHQGPRDRRHLRRVQRLRRPQPVPPEDRQPGPVPRRAERRVDLRRPALPVDRRVAQRQLVQQRLEARLGQDVVGGHQGLRHLEPRGAEVRRGDRDGLRFAHQHPGAGQARQGRLHLRLVVRAGWPTCPTASRRTTSCRSSRSR